MKSITRSKGPPKPRAGKSKRGKGRGDHHDQGPKTAVPRGVLVDLQDEVGDLAAILGCVPELQHFATTMEHDRIIRHCPPDVPACAPRSSAASKHSAPGDGFFAADLVDLGNAIDTIIAAVKWRLERVKQLLAVMT